MPSFTKGYYVAPVKKNNQTIAGDAKDAIEYDLWEDDLWNACAKWPDQWFRDDPRKAAPVASVGGIRNGELAA